nr:hypothetical protein [Mycoplasmopsis bovis]
MSLLNEIWLYWKHIYENIGKISGKTKEYLENDYESAHFCKKLAILNPRCWDEHWHFDNYQKLVLNQKWKQKKYWTEFGFYNWILDTYNLIRLNFYPNYSLVCL